MNTSIYPVLVTGAVTLNTGGTASITSAAVDTVVNGAKAHYAYFIIRFGTIASGGDLSVCKVQSCDTSGGTYADVTGAALASGFVDDTTDDDGAVVLEVDLAANKADRFLKMVVTTAAAANTPIVSIECLLTNFDIDPPYDDGLVGVVRV